MPTLILKPGREKPVLNQHPWVFSGAIRSLEGQAAPGDIVDVRAHDGRFLGRGYWNPQSQIQARLLTWEEETLNEYWWRDRLAEAVAARSSYSSGTAPAYRVVNAENDFIPGLVIDRYDQWLVLQALTLGIDRRKAMIAEILPTLIDTQGIYERSDADVRQREGLDIANGLLWGKEPPEQIVVQEQNVSLLVDVYGGHKTGAYLDQAVNRRLLADLIRQQYPDRFTSPVRLLNLFSYTGGFGLHALHVGGVQVTNVDSSRDALEIAELTVQHNNMPDDNVKYLQADAFVLLRDMADAAQTYDIIVLDPPKFAHSKGQVERAARGYKDINLNALNLVASGGWLMTFSCSGAISADLFQKIVFGALADSGRRAQIVAHLGPGLDHPVALTFPEGAYLKGLLLRVL